MKSLTSVVLVALVTLTGCSVKRETTADVEPTSARKSVPAADQDRIDETIPAASRPPGGSATTGTLVVTVIDAHGRPASGIAVEFSGATADVLTTDSKGRITFTAPAGNYRLDLAAGCTEDKMIRKADGGSAAIAAGKQGAARLETDWLRRVAPGEVAYASDDNDWPVGKVIDFSFELIDRCLQIRAPASDVTAWKIKLSGNVQLVSGPTPKTDSNARSHMKLKCTSKGAARVLAYDSKQPEDNFELQEFIITPQGFRKATTCV